jgi:hypothetical protein
MALNREGIEQLKADLRANAKHYNQNKFGVIKNACGTEACMAGMCLMRVVGIEEFTARVQKNNGYTTPEDPFIDDCLRAGAEQIGLTILSEDEYEEIADDADMETDGLPPIFSASDFWPVTLRYRYEDAQARHDHEAMAEIACEALDMIDENGVFKQ